MRVTAYNLLLSCPDDQIVRMQIVWRDVATGKWADAAAHLRCAANEGNTSWHERCAMLAQEYETKQ